MSPQEFNRLVQRIKRLPDHFLRRLIKIATYEEQHRLQKNWVRALQKWQKG